MDKSQIEISVANLFACLFEPRPFYASKTILSIFNFHATDGEFDQQRILYESPLNLKLLKFVFLIAFLAKLTGMGDTHLKKIQVKYIQY
jgi:hypothetical protein